MGRTKRKSSLQGQDRGSLGDGKKGVNKEGETQQEMTTQAERMVDALVGGQKGDGNVGEDTSEKEDESESDSEEENKYQEDSSEEESVAEGKMKCSVCNFRGSTGSAKQGYHMYDMVRVLLNMNCKV